MSISVGFTQLQDATKELMMRWARVRESWDDDKAREFEKDFIEPLKPRVRQTLSALERAGAVSGSARRECE